MTGVSVRKAGPADVASLSRVGWQSFEDAYRGTADDGDIDVHLDAYFSERAIRRELALPNVNYYLAECDGDCAGLIKLRQGEVPPPLTCDSAIEVQQVYVASEFHRRGIGHALLDAATTFGTRQGVDGLWLSVWTHAEWATRFYAGYGYVVKGEIPFTLGKSEFTDYLMWLDLKR